MSVLEQIIKERDALKSQLEQIIKERDGLRERLSSLRQELREIVDRTYGEGFADDSTDEEILAAIENLVGAKETIFEVEEVRRLVEATDEDFCVFTGMTFNLAETMAVGACGAICPLPNFIPRVTVDLYEACKAGDSDRVEELQKAVYALAPLLASTPTPHAMQKEALRLLGHPVKPHVKGPLPRLTSEQAKLVRETLENAGLL